MASTAVKILGRKSGQALESWLNLAAILHLLTSQYTYTGLCRPYAYARSDLSVSDLSAS